METQRRTHDGEDIVKQPETSLMQKKVMTEKKKKKKKKKKIPDEEEEGEDRISQLPDEILHHILSLIPLKRAARTSILSNRWKELWESKWAYTNTLNFDWKFTFGIKTLSLASSTINRILQLHRINTIQVFRLYFPPWNEFLPHIQQWIEFAVEKRARELDLDFKEYHNPLVIAKLSHDFDGGGGYAELSYDGGGGGGGGDDDGDGALLFLTTMTKKRKIREFSPYNPPHCLFFCDSLTSLKLANCKLELPSDFRGFSSLKTLHLRGVAFSHYTLDEMLLKCPMLEDLALMFWDKFNKLQLSPTYLKIKSFTMIGFHGSCMAGSFLSKLAHLRILTICQHRGWESKPAPRNSPITLPNVIELQLMVNGEYRLPDISSWFIFWNFPCLKTIVINRFFGIDDQMQMVKFLLQKAVVLETMVLVIPKGGIKGSLRNDSIPQAKSNVAQLRLLHELLIHLPKVSKNARFVLKECTDVDDSIVATLYGDLNSPFTLF